MHDDRRAEQDAAAHTEELVPEDHDELGNRLAELDAAVREEELAREDQNVLGERLARRAR